jgi:RNA polymerase sigma-70 factor (ECF subfamily)
VDAASRPDPEQLLSEARAGQADGLGRLLELYRNYLLLVARTQIDLHLRGQFNPSDVVQETFLDACRDFPGFRGSTEPELLAWLRRILVRNLGRLVERQLRTRKRDARREVSLDRRLDDLGGSADRVDAALAGGVASPSAQARRREAAALLADQLARLPEDYREVIILRNLEGLAFEEVARRMGRSPGAARVLWMRALDRLRGLLREEDPR